MNQDIRSKKCECGFEYDEHGNLIKYPEEFYRQIRERFVNDFGIFEKMGGDMIASTGLVLRYYEGK